MGLNDLESLSRDLMKRIKPDSWLVGEIAGTGVSS